MTGTEIHIETRCEKQNAVLFALQYFAIWQYPLKPGEILQNSNKKISLCEVEIALNSLLENHNIYNYKGYYSTHKNIQEQVVLREKGNSKAQQKMPSALQAGKLIFLFPFVRFVGISGSLSKNYAEDKSDFDFFIVTAKNRLWICRTILHVFKKFTFLLGQQHKFCMNYFIDETALEIQEQNHYTAMELATLIPVNGAVFYKRLQEKNKWLKYFLPNAYMEKKCFVSPENNLPVKSSVEWIIDNVFADKLNYKLMIFTDKRWRKKWQKKNYPQHDYPQAFKTRINISKNHPANYQKKVLEQLKKIGDTATVLTKK